MDADHLDAVARRLAGAAAPRRGLLRALGGAVLAADAGRGGVEATGRRHPCGPCHRWRRGRCRPMRGGNPGATCATDADCCGGLTCCTGACRDLATDPLHCGACEAAACSINEVCRDGACVCPANGDASCGGSSPFVFCCPSDSQGGCCTFETGCCLAGSMNDCCPNEAPHCCPPGSASPCCTVGHPRCCKAGFGSGNGIGCCPDYQPNCCPDGTGFGGCCPDDQPVCCPPDAQNPFGFCCPTGTSCCASGCCSDS